MDEIDTSDPEMIEIVLLAFIYVMNRWYRRAILIFISVLIAANQTIYLLQSFGVLEKK